MRNASGKQIVKRIPMKHTAIIKVITPPFPVSKIRYSIPNNASQDKLLPDRDVTQVRLSHVPEKIAIFGLVIPVEDISTVAILSLPGNTYQTPKSSNVTGSHRGIESGVASVVSTKLLNGVTATASAAVHRSLIGL